MKKYFALLAVSTLVLAGCNQAAVEPTTPPTSNKTEVTGTVEIKGGGEKTVTGSVEILPAKGGAVTPATTVTATPITATPATVTTTAPAIVDEAAVEPSVDEINP
jgi:hypothetical protein